MSVSLFIPIYLSLFILLKVSNRDIKNLKSLVKSLELELHNNVNTIDELRKEISESKNLIKQEFVDLRTISKIFGIKLNTLRAWSVERRFDIYKPSRNITLVNLEYFREWFEQYVVSGFKPRTRKQKEYAAIYSIAKGHK